MRRRWMVGLWVFLVSALAWWPILFGADQPRSQNWVGELRVGDSKRFVQLKIAADRRPMSGTIAFPAIHPAEIPLSEVSVGDRLVKFAWNGDGGPAAFDGRLSGGLLEGIVREGSKRGRLQLAPTVTLSADAQQKLIGDYEMRPGH